MHPKGGGGKVFNYSQINFSEKPKVSKSFQQFNDKSTLPKCKDKAKN